MHMFSHVEEIKIESTLVRHLWQDLKLHSRDCQLVSGPRYIYHCCSHFMTDLRVEFYREL
jgi:hypothetical protein